MNRVTYTVIGFILTIMGFMSLLLSIIGLRLWPVSIIDKATSPGIAILIKLLLIVSGIIMFYMSRVERDSEES